MGHRRKARDHLLDLARLPDDIALLQQLVRDLAGIFFIKRYRPRGLKYALCYTSFIFPIILLFFSYSGFMDMLKRIPIQMSKEDAIKHINDCNIYDLVKDSHKREIRISIRGGGFENGKYEYQSKSYVIAKNDFGILRESARVVKDRCGYRIDAEAFVPGLKGFQNKIT